MNYEIRITGEGTQQEIIDGLERLKSILKGSTPKELEDFEDEGKTLMCAISEKE